MKKLIKILAVVLSVFLLSTAVACFGGDEPSAGSKNMTNIMNAIYTNKIVKHTSNYVGINGEDIGHEGSMGDYEVDNYFSHIYAKDGRRGARYNTYDGPSAEVNGVVFGMEYSKQISEGEPDDKLLGYRNLEGSLVWNQDTSNFHIEAKIYEGANDTDYYFRLSNLSIDEYYENGSFNVSNCKVEDVESPDDATMIYNQFVAFVVEGINKCLDVIDEVYTAKGYPIGK